MAGMATLVHAGPNRDERDAAPAERREQLRSNEPRQPDAGRQAAAGSGADNGQKHGKMSPEERRALRRQINEAGQDIYLPRR
jgi:hypothetical protein